MLVALRGCAVKFYTMMKNEGIIIVVVGFCNSKGDMNVWTTFHGNTSDICWDISLQIQNLLVTQEEKTKHHESNEDPPTVDHESLEQVSLQSIQKLLSYFSLTRAAIRRICLLTWLKTMCFSLCLSEERKAHTGFMQETSSGYTNLHRQNRINKRTCYVILTCDMVNHPSSLMTTVVGVILPGFEINAHS